MASRFGEAEFNQVQVLDNGFAAESRPAIQFNRVLPAAFGAGHLAPGLLDPTGSARIALFEAQASVARRARGPSGLELHRNGDLLIGTIATDPRLAGLRRVMLATRDAHGLHERRFAHGAT